MKKQHKLISGLISSEMDSVSHSSQVYFKVFLRSVANEKNNTSSFLV